MRDYIPIITVGLIFLALVWARASQGQDGDFGNRVKHASVAFGVAGAISYLCMDNVRLMDGSLAPWGCFLMGSIPTIIGATFFEAAQNDLVDAEGDIAMALIFAPVGAAIPAYIFPRSWYDRKGVDVAVKGLTSVQFALHW